MTSGDDEVRRLATRERADVDARLRGALDVDELVATAQELIRCPSTNPPGDEEGVARVIARHLERAGARDVRTVVAAPGRHSVVCRWGEPGGRVLAWNGHTDVVPVGDAEEWRYPPFSGRVAGGRLWGRGATDMKGSVAAVIQALSTIARAGLEARGEVVFSIVGDEECGGQHGSSYLYEHGLLPPADAGICGEPTGLDVLTAARGRLWIDITTYGTSVHASQPERGTNAIVGMLKVAEALEMLDSSLRGRSGAALTATPTVIRGGDSPNSVPDHCTLTIDRRFLASEGADAVRSAISRSIERVRKENGIRIDAIERACLDASEIDPDAEIVQIAREAVADTTGHSPSIGEMRGATDARFLIAAGIPTIIFGPGDLSDAHTVDESVSLEALAAGALVYAAIICRFLGVKLTAPLASDRR
jgi:succinyl-diaminopimelate desuccinylase